MNTPKRRWLRFSLRTLFVVVTIACVGIGWRLHVARQHQALYDRLAAAKATVDTIPDGIRLSSFAYYSYRVKALLGFETVYEVWVDFNDDAPRPGLKPDLLTLHAMYPSAHFWGNVRGCGTPLDFNGLWLGGTTDNRDASTDMQGETRR